MWIPALSYHLMNQPSLVARTCLRGLDLPYIHTYTMHACRLSASLVKHSKITTTAYSQVPISPGWGEAVVKDLSNSSMPWRGFKLNLVCMSHAPYALGPVKHIAWYFKYFQHHEELFCSSGETCLSHEQPCWALITVI